MKKILISLLMFLSWNSYADINCGDTCTHASHVRVLMYHQVTASRTPNSTVVSPAIMSEQLDMLQTLGYTTVTIAEVVDFMSGKINLPKKSVAITFDDGWKDNIDAAKMLSDRNMAATFYVLTGAFNDPQYLSKDDIKWLSQNKRFEIGAHSHTHFMEWASRLDSMDDRIMIGELVMSKTILEEITGKSVSSFAWPFGYSRQNILASMNKFGFTSTVHVNSETKNKIGDNTLHIRRINVDGACTADHLKKMLETSSLIECK